MKELTEDIAKNLLDFLVKRSLGENYEIDCMRQKYGPKIVNKNNMLFNFKMLCFRDKSTNQWMYVWYDCLGINVETAGWTKNIWRNVLLGLLKISRNGYDICITATPYHNYVFVPAYSTLESLLIMKDLEDV